VAMPVSAKSAWNRKKVERDDDIIIAAAAGGYAAAAISITQSTRLQRAMENPCELRKLADRASRLSSPIKAPSRNSLASWMPNDAQRAPARIDCGSGPKRLIVRG